MTDYRYNYIIVGGKGFYEAAYNDLKSLQNVRYLSSYFEGLKSGLMRILARVNFNIKINRYIKSPFRHIVFPKLLSVKFENNRPLCFVFFNLHFALFKSGYIEYLRKKYPDARFVLYMQDIVDSLPYYDVMRYKTLFDCILSYDKGDSDKYGFDYYPTPYSKIDTSLLKKQEPIDVYFCGKAKNRFSEIIKAYNICREKRLSCRFYIYGVSESDRIKGEGLIYDRPLSYLDNLSYVMSCKYILEIMQKGADGFTPRLWEAMFYGKYLLTNNHKAKDAYGEIINIIQIDEIKHLEKLEKVYDRLKLDRIIETKSPVHLLQKLEILLT